MSGVGVDVDVAVVVGGDVVAENVEEEDVVVDVIVSVGAGGLDANAPIPAKVKEGVGWRM